MKISDYQVVEYAAHIGAYGLDDAFLSVQKGKSIEDRLSALGR